MRNFDVYQDDTTAAAYFISKYCKCDACPMYDECDLSPTHKDTKECFNKWNESLDRYHYTFWDEDDFADLLQDMIDCDKCPLNKENKCNPFDFSERCKDVFLKWLDEDREICQDRLFGSMEG